jgi:glycosyltransferase involved in cell wall biosynthesis
MINTFTPKFTYIIPFRYEADRIIPLRRVVEVLSGFQGIEILIVEQDKHSKISHLNLRANHIFIKSDLPFNKSWAFNVGLKRSHSPVVACADADFLMNPNDLVEALKNLETCECVIPTSMVAKLNPQQTLGDIPSIFNIKEGINKNSSSDGLVLFKRDALLKICGWNEDFLGLGYTNDYQDLKIKKILNWKQMDFIGYHLFHGVRPIDPNLNTRNLQIWEQFKDGDVNKINAQLQHAASRIGQLNKYSGF